MLTNLVDGSDAESVTVAVLQWLNLHLQMLGEDEEDDKDNDVYEEDEIDENTEEDGDGDEG